MLETVEVLTGENPEWAIIWLHGLGADGHDFEPLVPQLAARIPAARFVFPHAPVRPVTVNGGIPMRAWYDIVAFDGQPPQDQEGISASRRGVEALIEREGERGIGPERIVLAGFSQGGAIALYAGLRLEQTLAGIMGLSTYLLMSGTLADERSQANARTPVFVGHGVYDPVVPLMAGQHVTRTLDSMGYDVEWHDYPMPHAVCPEEVQHIAEWLARHMSP